MALFNKTLDIKLIRLVRDNPVLYNPGHSKHSDFDTRVLTWQKIGEVLYKPGVKCKSRWLNIRDMMRKRLMKRLRYPDQQFQKYRYEDELTFMIPFFKLNSQETPEYNVNEYLEDNIEAEIQEEHLQFQDHSLFRKTNEVSDAVPQELNPRDPLDVFLMTIGSTMKKFDAYYLNQAKSKIFQICQEYELQQMNAEPPRYNADT